MKEFKLFATLIQVAFIVMKLCGAIHWPWLLVFSPILLYLFRFVLAFFCVKHEIKQSQENFLDRMDNLKRLQQEYQDAVNKKQKELEDKRKEFMEQNNKQTMPDFELSSLYVFKEEDEDGELTIIGKLIAKNENEDTLTFGNQWNDTFSIFQKEDFWKDFPTQSPVCRRNDGIPFDVDRLTISFPKWRAESIKAYGNAWVPQVGLQDIPGY